MLKKLKKKKDKNRAVVCLSINKTKTMDTLSCTRASNAVARIGIYCNEKRYLQDRQTHNCTGSYPRHFINIKFDFFKMIRKQCMI